MIGLLGRNRHPIDAIVGEKLDPFLLDAERLDHDTGAEGLAGLIHAHRRSPQAATVCAGAGAMYSAHARNWLRITASDVPLFE